MFKNLYLMDDLVFLIEFVELTYLNINVSKLRLCGWKADLKILKITERYEAKLIRKTENCSK